VAEHLRRLPLAGVGGRRILLVSVRLRDRESKRPVGMRGIASGRGPEFDSDPEADPEKWWVFDPDGRLLGTVGVPAGLVVLPIGRDRVLGLWRDELDVERSARASTSQG
jgi:hypothetical protein